MAEDSSQFEPPAKPANDAIVAPVAAHCLRCGHDLSRLPEFAQYCPHCGLDTVGSPVTSATKIPEGNHAMSGLLGGWQHLAHIFRSPTPPQETSSDASSVMVKGYGNALYRLGRRYELGSGASANPREAMRCYSKSAKLGNFWAMARLASEIFVSHSDQASTDTPPPPESTAH